MPTPALTQSSTNTNNADPWGGIAAAFLPIRKFSLPADRRHANRANGRILVGLARSLYRRPV
jgi:hypothetical protein